MKKKIIYNKKIKVSYNKFLSKKISFKKLLIIIYLKKLIFKSFLIYFHIL